jgi:CubicO group peptidase (beta-lactamase class C family)
MRRRFSALCLATIAIWMLVRAPVHADDPVVGLFWDYLESLRTQTGIPGLAAAIVGDNDILPNSARGLGQADLDRSIPARTDTPFHVDGLTQVFTAALVLRCVDDGFLTLDDRIGQYKADSADPNATIRQLLTHTTGPPGNLTFSYRPERLELLGAAVQSCRGGSFRKALADLLNQQGMLASVPGPDVIHLTPPADGIPESLLSGYPNVLAQLAVPYAVDRRGHASASQYPTTTLTAAGGLISTVNDLARFDLALRNKGGGLPRAETLAAAWQPPVSRDGQVLPHGMGWFVQSYNGQRIVWQFGVSDNASSCLMVTIPPRITAGGAARTLILLANSDALVRPFLLASGDLTTSIFGRLFLELFVR